MLELKTRLETKLREELSHGSKAQASLLPSSSSTSLLGLPPLPGNLPQSRHGLEKNPWRSEHQHSLSVRSSASVPHMQPSGKKRWGAIFVEPSLQKHLAFIQFLHFKSEAVISPC